MTYYMLVCGLLVITISLFAAAFGMRHPAFDICIIWIGSVFVFNGGFGDKMKHKKYILMFLLVILNLVVGISNMNNELYGLAAISFTVVVFGISVTVLKHLSNNTTTQK